MKLIKIGRVAGTHGLKGHLKVSPQIDDVEVFYELEFLLLGKNGNVLYSCEIENIKYNKNNLIIKCLGVDSITEAEKYKGLLIYASQQLIDEFLDEHECFLDDFIGATAYDLDGNVVGKVVDLEDNGGNEIFVIEDAGGKQYLISNNENHVPKIDIKSKKIIIDKIGLVSEDL